VDTTLSSIIWTRLLGNQRVDDLGLDVTPEGRTSLRGLRAPEHEVLRTIATSINARVQQVAGATVVRGVSWRGLDFSSSKLVGLQIQQSEIADCVFASADCSKWRIWDSTIARTTFLNTKLRDCAFAGTGRQRTKLVQIDFAQCDFRGTGGGAEVDQCRFINCNLRKVGFGGWTFSNCAFEGELREIEFDRCGIRHTPDTAVNEMRNVDFSRTTLRAVDFRNLDLEQVRLPQDEDHLVLEDFPSALDGAIAALKYQDDRERQAVVEYLSAIREFAGKRGVLNRRDLLEHVSAKVVAELWSLLQQPIGRLHVNGLSHH
jgi:uncharacterized protein YjbI with pentapeptide repeats